MGIFQVLRNKKETYNFIGDYMLLFLKGIVIGLAKIIPGVSGSLIAIRLNVYEDIISSINNFFDDLRNNILYLSKIGFGILLSIIFGSNIIMYYYNNYHFITLIIFIALIVSGIPTILKNTKNYYITILSLFIYLMILFIPNIEIFRNYYIIGFLEAFTTIIPGISGTALFISLGIYDDYLDLFSNIYLFDISKIIPFIVGLIIGGLIIIRFINYCFKKYKDTTYSVILGLLLGSIILMIIKG